MLNKSSDKNQLGFYSTFEEQLSHRHPLYILANNIQWDTFEEAFAKLIYKEYPHNTDDEFVKNMVNNFLK